MIRGKLLAASTALTILASGAAQAEFQWLGGSDSGPYLGGSLGWSNIKTPDDQLTIPPSGSLSVDHNDFAYKFFAGYQVNRYIGIEGGYDNLGTENANYSLGRKHEMYADGWGASLVGTLPVDDKLGIFAKAGFLRVKNHVKENVPVGDPSGDFSVEGDTSSTRFTGGLGVKYDIMPHLQLRGEWEYFKVPQGIDPQGAVNVNTVDMKVNLFTAGVAYKF